MNIDIANRLYEYRKKHGLSQEQLAEQIGVSRQAVSKWERAESSPDTDNLIELAKLYNCKLDELLYTDEPTRRDPADTQNDKDYVNIGLGGIHVKDGEDEVHISLKDGVRITSGDDEEVHVSLRNGVKVKVNGETEYDSEEWAENVRKRWFLHLPVGLLAGIGYVFLGVLGGWWHPGWLIFLAVPVVYGIIETFFAKGLRNKLETVPIWWLAALAFFYLGFWWGMFHPGWLVWLAAAGWEAIIKIVPRTKREEQF
ncbi:MAG: helix-turn-helix domain-containing protein [Oscillospiraceae bacterium]|nr:helix-turn-helix domain-containing protein [Oscillospiraceae bacterium]